MEEVYLSLILVIILFLIINRRKENFISDVDTTTKNLFLNNLKKIFGTLLNEENIEVLKVKNSKKIIIRNLTKLIPIEKAQFISNFELSNIQDTNDQTKINLKLRYLLKPLEPKKNIFSGYYVSPNINTNEKNVHYGFYLEYNPDLEYNNFAELSIDYNDNQYKNIEQLIEIKDYLNSDKYYNKPRRTVKIYSVKNTPPEFVNYFSKGEDGKDIKMIAIFTSQNNSAFLKSFPDGKFNILDNNLIPILTYVDIDKPFCNIELEKRGDFYGRDKLIAGKYLPEFKKYAVLDTPEFKEFKDLRKETDLVEGPSESFIGSYINERFSKMNEHFTNELEMTENQFEPKYINYNKLSDCKKKENRRVMKGLIDNKQFSLFDTENLSLKEDKNIFTKLQELTGFKVRKHFSQEKFYYGGIDTDGIMKCLGSNGVCDLFDSEGEVVLEKNDNNEILEMYPTDETDPGYVGGDLKEKYIKYNNFDCIKHRKIEAPCKHIIDRKIVDIITFKNSNEINPVEIINSTEILDLHNLVKEKLEEKNITPFDDEYKEKLVMDYLIEPYDDENKDIDLGKIFETLKVKIRIEDKIGNSNSIKPIDSIIKIIDGEKTITLQEDTGDLILLKNDKIHLFLNNRNKLNINVIRNNIIISSYIFNKKLEGKFGKDINLFLRTNNTDMFQNLKSSEKISNLTYPYNPFIDVKSI